MRARCYRVELKPKSTNSAVMVPPASGSRAASKPAKSILRRSGELGFPYFEVRCSRLTPTDSDCHARPNADSAFQIIRFKIITDDGQEVELIDEMRGKGYDVTIE